MRRTISRRAALALPVAAAMGQLDVARPAAQAGADVPTYRGDAARTGENPGPGPSGDPAALWQLRLGRMISSSPVVVDGVVYVGSIDPGSLAGGALHAVEAATGIERWRLAPAPGDGIFATAAVGEGIVVTGTYDGTVVAADARTGEERWRVAAEATFYGSPALMAGIVYIADTNGHLHALDAASGAERWRVVVGRGFDRALTTPAVAGDTVWCVDASRRPGEPSWLHAWDAASGEERWRYGPDDGSVLRFLPVVAGGAVWVASRQPVLRAVDVASGEEVTRLDIGAITATELAVVSGAVVFGAEDGTLHAWDIASGRRAWSVTLTDGAALVAAPVVADGVVYAGDADGRMHAVDLAGGAERWRSRIGSLRSSPAVTGGALYVGSNNGALRAVAGPDE
jgi:outer membrane protein assembly factor BamB